MRWESNEGKWETGFAILPVRIGTTWIWLQRFWFKDHGRYCEYSLTKPEVSLAEVRKSVVRELTEFTDPRTAKMRKAAGNVFADLKLPDADILLAVSDILIATGAFKKGHKGGPNLRAGVEAFKQHAVIKKVK